MKIGIICASDDELAPFLSAIENCKETERAMLKFYEGQIFGVDVAAVYSGVCKVNAAAAAQIMIDTFAPDAVINSGTAGGMDPRLKIFDTAVSEKVCYHDVLPEVLTEFHPWMKSAYFTADRELVEKSKEAVLKTKYGGCVFWGKMATGEAFIEDDGRREINDKFAPLTTDMESAAIAHVCYLNGVPFIAIRCVTDTAEHSGNENFEKNCQRACTIAADITLSLINELGG